MQALSRPLARGPKTRLPLVLAAACVALLVLSVLIDARAAPATNRHGAGNRFSVDSRQRPARALDGSTPPAGYQLVETVTLPVNGSSTATATTLQSGLDYKIRASGTFTIGGAPTGTGDAEYGFNSDYSTVVNACPDGTDVGVGINDTINDSSKSPAWGAFSSTHEYTIDFTGIGGTRQLQLPRLLLPG
jgi:hypothetical protein